MDRPPFSHLDAAGQMHMVDVSAKTPTLRRAAASAELRLGEPVYRALLEQAGSKGDALAAARIAGIQAAKRTSELIPLCHGLAPEHIQVQFEPMPPERLRIRATAQVVAKTGVEMEALVAASVAALTIYDMCKALSKAIVIGPIQLEEKSGGQSGTWTRGHDPPAQPPSSV